MSVLRKTIEATKDVAASVPPGWLGSSYRQTVLAAKPLAYWGLDDPPGSALGADLSGNDRPLTYLSGVTLGVPGLVDSGTAASRTSAGGFGRVDAAAWMNVPEITLEAVIIYESRADYRQIIDRHQHSSGTLQFRVMKTGQLEFIFWTSTGGPHFAVGATALTIGVPYHVAATFNDSQGRVFVNGVQDGSFAATGQLKTTGTDRLHVGVSMGGINSVGLNPFLGVIDEVAYHGRALTSTELQSHAVAAGLGGD